MTYPTDTAVPTLVPVQLGGPTAGTVMSWMDGSSLVYVPAGQFNMGASGLDNPSHTVSLSSYWISRTKITNRMYALCVGVGVCAPPATTGAGIVYSNPTFADHPVVGVTWEQAGTYCGWAGGRLPTEAEWEKAARGPGGQTYPWGNEQPSCDLLNYAGCVNSTSSVISYPASASPYLALDMAGNAFEWVGDWYGASYYATSPIQDPIGAESGIYRVIRGSGFESDFSQIASAIRRPADPNYTSRDLGFRCVVQQPINFPPYCQASAYLPNAEISTPGSVCQAPVAQRLGPSCKGKVASNTIILPRGTTYRIRSAGYTCTDAIVGGMLQVTCYGPDATSGTLEVCDPSCTDQAAPVYSESAVCDPGYSYDPATRQCTYTPQSNVSGTQACPAGYALELDRAGLPPDHRTRQPVPGRAVLRHAVRRLCAGERSGELQSIRHPGCLAGRQLFPGLPGGFRLQFCLAVLPGACHRSVSRLPAGSRAGPVDQRLRPAHRTGKRDDRMHVCLG